MAKALRFLTRYRLVFIGTILGGLAGYAWYLHVGCPDGTCPISSSPLRSTAYFAVIGALFGHSFIAAKKPADQSGLSADSPKRQGLEL